MLYEVFVVVCEWIESVGINCDYYGFFIKGKRVFVSVGVGYGCVGIVFGYCCVIECGRF